mmetsp:Transcript_68809/g.77007  ORF Transcript_68809/g.77007 Transcript_68809/m.77007 type:complete len:316 (+) Transcript_68809:150-1097(+)
MRFPRISMSGTLILLIYVTTMKYLFDKSLYGTSLRSGIMLESSSSRSMFLNSLIMSTSLLNVASHSAVVLGALDDTYVLSILIGVGFDVTTRILQLIWWMRITMNIVRPVIRIRQQEDNEFNTNVNIDINITIGFCSMLTITYVYHMILHLRALRMNYSYQRLNVVLTGALNNLRGIPGENFQDHLFAYSDLGSHLLPLCLSVLLLQRQKALITAFFVLVLLLVVSYVSLSSIPVNNNEAVNINECDDKSMKCIQIYADGRIICSCTACRKRCRRTGQESSFTFNYIDGICHLWLCSFGKLSTFLSSSNMIHKLQ